MSSPRRPSPRRYSCQHRPRWRLRRVRSQLESIDCDIGDSHGRAELRFAAQAGADYLIRVGQRANSVAGDFRLDVFAPQPPPKPPGRRLRARGVHGSVDALQDTADAYSLHMRPGRSYRINLARRSDVRLILGDAPFTLVLLNDRGRHITGSSGGFPLELRMAPGRYYVAVIAHRMQRGRYVLRRAARTITATSITIDGRRSAIAAPGRTVRVGVGVAPGAAGPVLVTVERFDPLAGWQFFRQVELRAAAGSAAYAFRPPTEGRWRASAQFLGDAGLGAERSGFGHLLVASPLALASAAADPLLLRRP